MNKTPVANRLHIGIFGRVNAGKSSFINALTGQDISIVSSHPGTTTDPVYKTMEILPEPGPCVIIDTAGLNDTGVIGDLRKNKSINVLNKTDLAILIVEPGTVIQKFEEELIGIIRTKKIPLIIVVNKMDIAGFAVEPLTENWNGIPVYKVSSKTGQGIFELRSVIAKHAPSKIEDLRILKGLVKKGDLVVLVIPVDSAMPKGRLILPEVQTLRAVLDEDATAVVCKEYELKNTLSSLKREPDLVITDSQVYHLVKEIVPPHIRLTSFSMLFARYKGDFNLMLAGAKAIDNLKPGDKVLISEACTHHPQPQDIGRFKIPNLLKEKAGGDLDIEITAGGDFPTDVSAYRLVIMCGSCMINSREVMNRIERANEAGIPVTNYGILFAKLTGILDRTGWLGNIE